MTCADCRMAMLEADPAELRGAGASELATHLRGCRSCRAAAGAIVGDTRALARVLALPAAVNTVRRRAAIGALAAAAIVVAVSVRAIGSPAPRPTEAAHVAQPAPRVATLPAVDSAHVRVPPPDASANGRAPAVSNSNAARRRIRPVAIQPAAFVAVPIRHTSPADVTHEPPAVAVRPHDGRRAAVFRVADSNVTVVWLY